MRTILTLCFFIALSLLLPCTSNAQAKVLPEFQFTRMDNGAAFTKANIAKGKKSLIVFFDTECVHCRNAMVAYNKDQAKLKEELVAIYLVSREKKEQALYFVRTYAPELAKKKNLTFLSDTKNEFISRFQPYKFPSMFLYGKDQKLIKYSDEEKDIPSFVSAIGK
jgi:thiol-disulfide isomerase/thioredoxin